MSLGNTPGDTKGSNLGSSLNGRSGGYFVCSEIGGCRKVKAPTLETKVS